MTIDPIWYASHQTLIDMARWLEGQNVFANPTMVIEFFEAPWKWHPEYARYKTHLDAYRAAIKRHPHSQVQATKGD